MHAEASPVVELCGVGVRVDGARLLHGVQLALAAGEHLAVLGPNGSGKTTLLRVLSTYRFPSDGDASVLGVRFGAADLRPLRASVGFVSTALDDLLHVRADALPLVAAARRGSLWPAPGILDDPQVRATAQRALERVGAGHLAGRRVDTLSQGERQRVRIARALVAEPALLLLDEPFAGLDLGGRESLLRDLDALLDEPGGPTTVLVTHHLEELPRGIRRALLLREGTVVAQGPVGEVLRNGPVSACFGLPVAVESVGGRFTARAVTAT
ncbi:ABC transporter ATP-binding protein [Egicoccus halophilus]|uniref:Iron ABC transporter ATP-binding protein n=1 Tax=Egicoccus halophilus TaxID=1670830 RepID=A0A8J3AH35_9ACTN|nr:ATP-binding cassette domain-containing protein [Egicoccus halophilus]GGI09025.1 iron ABC transporter ATP-binding protein [Egicoccus halophilus]